MPPFQPPRALKVSGSPRRPRGEGYYGAARPGSAPGRTRGLGGRACKPAARRGWSRGSRCRRGPSRGCCCCCRCCGAGGEGSWVGSRWGRLAGRDAGAGMRLGLLTTFVTLRPGWLGFDTPCFPTHTAPHPQHRRPQPSCSSRALPVAAVLFCKPELLKQKPKCRTFAQSLSLSAPTDLCVCVGAVIPRISEVLTFGMGADLSRCSGLSTSIYLLFVPSEAAGEGRSVIVPGEDFTPLCGQFAKCGRLQSALLVGGCVPSPAFHPAPHPLLRRIFFFPPLAYCL